MQLAGLGVWGASCGVRRLFFGQQQACLPLLCAAHGRPVSQGEPKPTEPAPWGKGCDL